MNQTQAIQISIPPISEKNLWFFLSKFYVALLHSESQWNVSSNCTYSFKIAFLYCYLMLSLCLDKNSFKTHSLLQLNIYLGWLLYYLSILQPLVN